MARSFLASLLFLFSIHSAIAQQMNPQQIKGTAVIQIPTSGNQTIIQPAGTSLGINLLNNIHYANQWCTHPGTLDDTCFSNAISDIAAYGPIGPNGHRSGTILVPPGTYTFAQTVVIPNGINIGIQGQYQTSLWGSIIQAGVPDIVLFRSEADSFDMNHLVFYGNSLFNITAIQIGTATVPTFDTHINFCWFADLVNSTSSEGASAIHIVNGGGLDLSHNTFDSNVAYAIYSDFDLFGDVMANYIIASDVRGFGQASVFHIHGDPASPDNWRGNQFHGLITNGTNTKAQIDLKNVQDAYISGIFTNDNAFDINIQNSTGIDIGPFVSYNSGSAPIRVDSSTDVNIHDGVMQNPSVNGGEGAIVITGSTRPRIFNNSTALINGATAVITNGLWIDGATTGSMISGNNFNAQTGTPYNVSDTTAITTIYGALVNPTLAGSGTAMACLDSSGKLIRGTSTTCP